MTKTPERDKIIHTAKEIKKLELGSINKNALIIQLFKDWLSNNTILQKEQFDRFTERKQKYEAKINANKNIDKILNNEVDLWIFEVDYSIFWDDTITSQETFMKNYADLYSERKHLLKVLFENFAEKFKSKLEESTNLHFNLDYKLEEYIYKDTFSSHTMYWVILGHQSAGTRITINPMLLLKWFNFNDLIKAWTWKENDSKWLKNTRDTFVSDNGHLNGPTLL